MAFVCPECGRSFPGAGFCTEHGTPLADGAHDPLLGQPVGSFRIARLIGRGGMGEVYLGVHPEIGSRVAIKVLAPGAALSRALVDRFFAEARAVNLIRHEGLVNVLDLAWLGDGRPYIMMEYLDGAALSVIFARERAAPLGALVELVLGVLDALGAAHAQGITHRDLKPDNVFVTASGRPKLLDFGIAKLKPELAMISDHTRTGALLGTPAYMSPEQARGANLDTRTDLYSVGVILYEGACGRRPFDADSLYELLRLQIETPPARPSTLRPDLPPALESVILRALEKDPNRRFQTSGEFSQALADAARFVAPSSFAAFARAVAALPTPRPATPQLLAPTTPGYAATVTGRVPARQRSIAVFVVLGVLGLGAIVAATAFGTLLLFGDSDRIQVVEAPRAGDPEIEIDFDDDSDPGPENPVRGAVDPVGYLPEVRTLARKTLADAELASLVVEAPNASGKIDASQGSAVYTFVSKSAPRDSVASCALWIVVSDGEAIVSPAMSGQCSAATRPPRCTIAQIVGKLGASGEELILTYGPNAQWMAVDGKQPFPKQFADDC